MKKLIKIFLITLPVLYLNPAIGDDGIVFILKGKITGPDSPTITIKGSQCTFNSKSTSTRLDDIGEYSRRIVCAKDTQTITLNTSSSGSIYNVTPTTHTIDLSKLSNSSRAVLDITTKQIESILVQQEEAAAEAASNTSQETKNTPPKKKSDTAKKTMKQNALKAFCEPVNFNGTQNYGHFDDDCTSTTPNIKIICYKKKNIRNLVTIKKRYNNYCFSNKENLVTIDEFKERACTPTEADALNAKSCKTNDDGKRFYDITCKNTNDIVDADTSKCISFDKQQNFTFQIENSTKNNDKINLHIEGLGAEYNECRSSTNTIASPSTNITVECTKRIHFQITAEPVDSIESIGGKSGNSLDVTEETQTPIVIKLKLSSNENAENQDSDDANNNENAEVAAVVVDQNSPDPNEPKWKKEEIDAARDAAESARETENSDVNKLLGSVGMGATGIGGMMLMQGLSEKAADDDATRAMQAYISTFNCTYGSNRVAGGTVAEIPGGNELIALYSEYVNLANNLKSVKNELDMRAGIESEPILDSATSGLYDDVSVGGTSGAYASLARALMNPNGTDAAAWAEQTEKTSKNITTGAITAGAGAGVSMIGDLTNKLVEKKKAEKSTKSK